MFTGIVKECGTVTSYGSNDTGALELVVRTETDFFADSELGDSICVDGCCLTLCRKISAKEGVFELSPETRTRTVALAEADQVHLEHSLRIGDQLGGHFVFGHVDGVVTVTEVTKTDANCYEAGFSLPKQVAEHFVVPKGSVAVAGVSLTVARTAGRIFWVQLIPTTWRTTKLAPEHSLKVNARFNFEIDQLARYVHGDDR